MSWPKATDYHAAIQNLDSCVEDEELRAGEPAVTTLGLPMLWSGNFADVYKVDCPATGNTWALKCFTREAPGLRDRYREISAHLERVRLPFTVDFQYLERGIRVNGDWCPALKMRWVEGFGLNHFVRAHLDRPKMLGQLLDLWAKLAFRLREARVAHADLQHGNVILVPMSGGQLALRLIDYDGMHVPALADIRSGELGHPAYQHPQRLRQGTYSAEVDRFSHLVIYCAVHCLAVGPDHLWQRFNNGDNLLFRETDFQNPDRSEVFRVLGKIDDAATQTLVGQLMQACRKPLEQVPLLEEILRYETMRPPARDEDAAAASVRSKEPTSVEQPWWSDGPLSSPLSLSPSPSSPPSLSPSSPLPPSPLPGDQPVTVQDTDGDASSGTFPGPVQPDTGVPGIGLSALQYPVRRMWPVVCWSDRLAAKTVGEENRIARGVVRAGAIGLLLGLLGLAAKVGFPMVGSVFAVLWPNTTATTESPPVARQIVITNSIGMEFVSIPAGRFMMGSPDSDATAYSNEKPRHPIRITEPFFLGVTEVTQAQYDEVMGQGSGHVGPSHFKESGPDSPVESVSWEEAKEFCRRLSNRTPEKEAGRRYRLPTEAEWEYACRAGREGRYCYGEDPSRLGEYAWFANNSDGRTHTVGQKKPNAWGLYDMHGNVFEWCEDWYGPDYYASLPTQHPTDDPPGPSGGSTEVDRGGGWNSGPGDCRSASRSVITTAEVGYYVGMRVCFVPADD